MRPLRVLVVDDSAFNRVKIAEILEGISGVSVVGKAANGEEALRLLVSLEPDLVTLDLEMPKMDGFSFLRFVMARRPVPVIMISTHSGKQNVFRALELGAIDFIAKPSGAQGEGLAVIAEELVAKVSMVRQLRPAGLKGGSVGTVSNLLKSLPRDSERPLPARDAVKRLVVVAASTGGPTALVEFFSWLTSDAPVAVIVVQHMPPRFTRTFAARLDRLGGLRVTEAADGDRLRAGRALVCPGGQCLEVHRVADGYAVRVGPPGEDDRYAPSADRAMRTAAAAAGRRAVGVVLTGMGDDGAAGVVAIKQAKGTVFVQSPEDAILDGMPRAASATGVADEEHALRVLSERIASFVSAE